MPGQANLVNAWSQLEPCLKADPKPPANGKFSITTTAGPALVNWEFNRYLPSLNLVTITILPADDYFREFDLAARHSLLSMLAVIGCAGVAVFVVARYLMRPIRMLGQQAAALVAGDKIGFDTPSPILEVNFLLETFEAMARNLHQTQEKLETAMNERNAELLELRNQLSFDAFNAASIAHEVKGPISNSILAISHMASLSRSIKAACTDHQLTQSSLANFLEECSETSTIIQANLERSVQIAKSFQNILVDQLGEHKQIIQLQNYLDQVLFSLKPLLRQAGIRLCCEWGPLLSLTIDPGLLAHIMANLVNNTILHGFPADWSTEKVICLKAWQDDGGTTLEYRDNGQGMSPEVLEKIFDPLFTTGREKGSAGLGLSLIRRSIEQKTGGSIRVTSELGQGSCFTIRFPPDSSAWG